MINWPTAFTDFKKHLELLINGAVINLANILLCLFLEQVRQHAYTVKLWR